MSNVDNQNLHDMRSDSVDMEWPTIEHIQNLKKKPVYIKVIDLSKHVCLVRKKGITITHYTFSFSFVANVTQHF